MQLRSILRALARSWPAVAVCTLLGISVGWTATALTTPVYEAHTQLFVSARSDGDTAQLQQGSTFSLARVQSYANIVTSRQVTGPVVARLRLHTTADELAGRITAEAPLNTVLINITVSDTKPRRAAVTADAVAQRFSDVVEKLETPDDKAAKSPVKLGITQTAAVPSAPVSPRTTLNLAVGLLAGLLLGAGVAVLREALDTTLKTTDTLAELTTLPVLGVIPFKKGKSGQPLAIGPSEHSARAEAYRHLRTNLQFAQFGESPQVIIVTSALPGEGKTSTAASLALSLAETGTNTCLVDADLRKPSVARMFGLVQDAGLTSALIGQADIDDVLQQAAGRLSVLTSGPLPPNPAELLASAQMAKILRELAARYDAVIVDTGPLLPVADTVGLAPLAHAALLVVRARKTPRDQVKSAVGSLHMVGARPLGTVFNMDRMPKHAGYGSYGHPLPAEQPSTTTPPRPRTDALLHRAHAPETPLGSEAR